jgi:hypothetical protein
MGETAVLLGLMRGCARLRAVARDLLHFFLYFSTGRPTSEFRKEGNETMNASRLIDENRVRRLAARLGYRVEVSRVPLGTDNQGKFQLIELDRHMVVLGERFDASLADIEAYLTHKETDSKN